VGLAGADVLVTFVKEPRPGAVKSRLAARLGPERAAAVYRAIAEEEMRGTCPAGDEYERLFYFDPPDARREIEDWLPDDVVHPQCAGDLGTRMAHAFAEPFARGARRVALAGSDVPWLSREDVAGAFAALDHHDVAIGPATDGGYYLVALRRPQPELFREIAWSTEGVLARTLERAAGLRLGVSVLRTLGDVDTAEDLAADWRRIGPILPASLRAEVAALLFPASP
jgi:rSAM/selenodomain-associated transferase 1